MKILSVEKSAEEIINYSVIIETDNNIQYHYVFSDHDGNWDMTNEEIIKRYKMNYDGDCVYRKGV